MKVSLQRPPAGLLHSRLGSSPSIRHRSSSILHKLVQPQVARQKNTLIRPLQPQWKIAPHAAGAALLAVLLIGIATVLPPDVHAEAPVEGGKIRLSEVREHGRNAERFWVVKDTRVYDITDWVPNHPGGDVILRAAGGNIEPYWRIFSIHQKQDVYDVLEQYYIGDVDPQDLVDGKVPTDQIDDPFQFDPQRDERLRVLSEKPCNAETPASGLSDYITPNKIFYVRNHLWVPRFTESSEYEITIELPDGEEKSYTVGELQTKFKQHTVTAVLQCSGNRRAHMSAGARVAQGLQWNVGAIGNAEWTGVRLRDVLKDAGFDLADPPEEAKHAQFSGAEAYGASIPIDKAIDRLGDVLLAFKMNGEPLPRDHGYPVRALVPGTVAARSVKWLKRITISEDESQSQWQQRDYKCFGPNVVPSQGSSVDWGSAPAIQETPVQSAITHMSDIESEHRDILNVYGLAEDAVCLEGYAFSGGGRRIVRVDVSPDDGLSWRQAELLPTPSKGSRAWGWQLWRIAVPKNQLGRRFAVKAVDDSYNTQPESYEASYNFRGNLAQAWHRVPYDRPT